LIKKFPTVLEKNSENRRGGFFLTHTVHRNNSDVVFCHNW